MVVRKSGYISDRTLMVKADKSAADIPRDMARMLRNPDEKVTIHVAAFLMAERRVRQHRPAISSGRFPLHDERQREF